MSKTLKLLFFFFLLFSLPAVAESDAPLRALVDAETLDNPPPISTVLDWKGYFTIALFALVFISMLREFFPPDLTMLIAAGILVVAQVITLTEFLLGFSKDIIFTIAMLCIVVRALEVNGIIGYVSKSLLSKSKSHFRDLLSILLPVSSASAFLNNTPIVLLMTPVIKRWSTEKGISPSKYLIPLSYAAILGGVCTLIGTSANLIVDGLLRNEDPAAGLSFFEIARVGLPCAIVGILFLLFFSYRLLPNREDPTQNLLEQTREFTGEFLVQEGSPLAGLSVEEAAKRYFHGELLIEIERRTTLIDSPQPTEKLQENDRLVFVGDINHIAQLHAVEGLQSLADPHFKLDPTSPHFSEVVISITSSLIGKTLRKTNFRSNYGASVIAVYRNGRRVVGNVGDVILHAGDTLMLLSGDLWSGSALRGNDFYYIRHNEPIHLFTPNRVVVVLATLFAMIGAAVAGVPMMIASLCAALVLILSKSISIRQVRRSISWNVLILIAGAFGMAKALQVTGVANFLAEKILTLVGDNPYTLIGTIFAVTLLATEFITNSAAVLLIFPIAMQTSRLAGFETLSAMKAVGVTVAIAASCSFITPIGYQTNTIVYGPGGYKFTDYMKIGLPLSFLIFILATFLIPRLWPMAL